MNRRKAELTLFCYKPSCFSHVNNHIPGLVTKTRSSPASLLSSNSRGPFLEISDNFSQARSSVTPPPSPPPPPTGSPSSKYEHWRASALLRNIQNIRICMGKNPAVSVTFENERISIKNSLPYLKCVFVSPVWPTGRFMAVLWVFL